MHHFYHFVWDIRFISVKSFMLRSIHTHRVTIPFLKHFYFSIVLFNDDDDDQELVFPCIFSVTFEQFTKCDEFIVFNKKGLQFYLRSNDLRNICNKISCIYAKYARDETCLAGTDLIIFLIFSFMSWWNGRNFLILKIVCNRPSVVRVMVQEISLSLSSSTHVYLK